MGFSRLLPDVAGALEMYRSRTMTALDYGRINDAYQLVQLWNAVLPEEYRVEVFENEAEFDEWLKRQYEDHDGKHYGHDDLDSEEDDDGKSNGEDYGPKPQWKDQIQVFPDVDDLEDRMNYQSNQFKWVYRLGRKIEHACTKFRQEYKGKDTGEIESAGGSMK